MEILCHHSLIFQIWVFFIKFVHFIFLELSINPALNKILVPEFAREKLRQKGIDLDQFQPIAIPQPNLSD